MVDAYGIRMNHIAPAVLSVEYFYVSVYFMYCGGYWTLVLVVCDLNGLKNMTNKGVLFKIK